VGLYSVDWAGAPPTSWFLPVERRARRQSGRKATFDPTVDQTDPSTGDVGAGERDAPSGILAAGSRPVSCPGRYIAQVPRESSSPTQSWPITSMTSMPGIAAPRAALTAASSPGVSAPPVGPEREEDRLVLVEELG